MSIQNVSIKLKSVSPLIMHSGRFVDPAYWATKALKSLSKNRNKTEADIAEMARIEFLGGLYVNEAHQVILPDIWLEATMKEGAKKSKRGKLASAGLYIEESAVLNYGEQKSPEDLYADEKYRLYVPVRVGTAKVMRMRPIFRTWEADVRITFDDTLLSEKDVLECALAAGHQSGLGDWRPKYGRYTVERA